MRYIEKSNRYPEFDDYVNSDSPTVWADFKTDIKLKLHRHLWREQQGLCIYCQQEIPEKTGPEYNIRSHIEHIRPRSHPQYAHLTFCYENLSISCEGFDCKTEHLKPQKEFCEHRKGNEYDEDKFLNPVELPDVEQYFEYNIEGEIHPNSTTNNGNQTKAEYMIKILDLNHPKLKDMRKEHYDLIIEQPEFDIEDFLNLNYEFLPPFFSMLKQLFI